MKIKCHESQLLMSDPDQTIKSSIDQEYDSFDLDQEYYGRYFLMIGSTIIGFLIGAMFF